MSQTSIEKIVICKQKSPLTIVSVALGLMLWPTMIDAQQVDVEKAAQEQADATKAKAYDLGPFTFTAGPTDNGYFGASLKGEGRQVIAGLSQEGSAALYSKPGNAFNYSTYIGYSADAGWIGSSDAANNASFSIRPGIDFMWLRVPADMIDLTDPAQVAKAKKAIEESDAWGKCQDDFVNKRIPIDLKKCAVMALPRPIMTFGAFGDVRYRYGTFNEANSPQHANQAILGGGLSAIVVTPASWAWVRQWPRFSAGYYTVKQTHTSIVSIPSDITADYLQASAATQLNLGALVRMDDKRNDYRFRIDMSAKESKPTSGSDQSWNGLYSIALLANVGSSWKPAISFQTGREGGLKYDRQLILGVAYDFLVQ